MIVSANRFRLGGSRHWRAGRATVSRMWPRKVLGWARVSRFAAVATAGLLLAACASMPGADYFGMGSSPPPPPPAQPSAVGTGQVKVALLLPLSAPGNAGPTALSLRNAAEIILGPLFAQSVSAAGQVARQRGVPLIAYSTDASVAAPGVHLLSFLPETEVDRVIGYAIQQGKKSFAALIPDNAYGTVTQAAFQQAVARGGGRVVAMERYPLDRNAMQEPIRRIAQAAQQADAIFIPDGADSVVAAVQGFAAGGLKKRVQLIGTGLWDDPRIFAEQGAQGAWFAAPEPAGFRAFSGRYRS